VEAVQILRGMLSFRWLFSRRQPAPPLSSGPFPNVSPATLTPHVRMLHCPFSSILQSCLGVIMDSKFETYMNAVVKADCAAEVHCGVWFQAQS
jgi:hypothetical protein